MNIPTMKVGDEAKQQLGVGDVVTFEGYYRHRSPWKKLSDWWHGNNHRELQPYELKEKFVGAAGDRVTLWGSVEIHDSTID